ncbi:transporter substrate-binding domain-containing protein [Rheinheimera sediminis]|uniref:substrate-binding periplasmic protein n=1 Tax=Rheinheimera sp. YQF-1 TaxID=2499626 RepID=UPI000FDA7976|nr:transporter substrate-binding domain-containing protein [Rheinheimera sp. YQF-1]RVT41507.1 transporter substrate-binding domain-containing protein [Rheinheimera sp. YQF-1]
MRWSLFLCIAISLTAQAKTELTILVGLDKPPYIELKDSSGYELDLLRVLSKKMGFDAVFLHVPNARIKDLMLDGRADMATLQRPDPEQQVLYYSQPYIRYQNIAASLASKTLQLHQLEQLKPYSVVAFHNARTLLGPDYQQVVPLMMNYQEVAHQRQQLQMLLLERCDVVVMDRNIFYYYAKLAGHGMQSFDVAALFQPSLYSVAFTNPQLRKKFDKALAEVQLEPVFTQLQLKYFSEVNQQLQWLQPE